MHLILDGLIRFVFHSHVRVVGWIVMTFIATCPLCDTSLELLLRGPECIFG